MSLQTSAHEHIAAGTATGISLALPIDIQHWLMHVATSVLVGLLTWALTHGVKALIRKLR